MEVSVPDTLARPGLPGVLCLGETLVLFANATGQSLEAATDVGIYVAGAESNVARGLAHLGHEVEWFGRLGNDPFGSRVLQFLESRGVSTARVITDDGRPTGVYFKEQVGDHSEIYYYRSGSAAAAMSNADLTALSLGDRRLCHTSGITAALSGTCNELLQTILIEREKTETVVSFDVNYRPRLWSVAAAAPRLLELARAADIVMVGRDEAQELWGTEYPQDVRELLADVPELIVKDADRGATYFSSEGDIFVPALRVLVLEPVGAGDAFAAGLLSGWLRGWEPARSLRLGHLMAACTLQDVSDVPPLPDADVLTALTKIPDTDWETVDSQAIAASQELEEGRNVI